MSPAIQFVSRSKGRLTLVAILLIALASAMGAIAYWTTTGSGSATANAGTLTAASISTPATSTGSNVVSLDVQATMLPASENPNITYSVERDLDGGGFAAVASGDCASLAYGDPSCTDLVTQSGTYTYRVIAYYAGDSWTAASNEVQVVANTDSTAPTTAITFPLDGGTYGALGFGAGCSPTGICGTASDPSGVQEVRLSIRQGALGLYWDGTSFASLGEIFVLASLLSPAATSTNWDLAFGLPADATYTIHVQSKDTAGNEQTGTTYSSVGTFTIDTTGPTVTVTTPANAGSTNDATPTLSGAAGNAAGDSATVTARIYSGTGTGGTVVQTLPVTRSGATWTVDASTLAEGTYTVQATQSDAGGNVGLSNANTFTIDTTSPTVTLTAPVNGSATNDATPTLSGAAGNATGDSTTVTVTIYNGTGTGGTVAQTIPVTRTGTAWSVVAGTLAQGTYTARATQADSAGNIGTSNANTFTVDTTAPSVTLTAPVNGSATNDGTPTLSGAAGNATGDSTTVTVTIYNGTGTGGTVAQTLTPTRTAGSWTTTAATLTEGTYTAQAIQTDTAGNTGTSSANAFTVDTTPPTVTVNQKAGQADPTNTLPILYSVTFSEPVTGFVAADLTRTGTSTGGTVAVTGSGANYEIAVTGTPTNGTIIFTVAANRAVDLAGNNNTASTSTDNSVTYDTVAPTVTVNQKAGQADPTNTLPILYTVTFSEPVTGLDATDLSRGGTATGGTVAVTGSGAAYEIEVTGTPSNGTINFTIAASKAQDLAGNNNSASTSTDNTVTYDTIAPTVTINQAAGQVDPTNTAPINFTVVFSESTTSFATGDVTLSGTASPTTATVTGSGTTYNVAVSGMSAQGTVVASIAASVATDAAGNDNTASTSTDNSVTRDTIAPTVTVNQKVGQADPANTLPILYTVTFSEPVTGFDGTDLTRTGTSTGGTVTVTGSGANYEIAVTGTPTNGTIILTIAASRALDLAANNNTASTSTDNSVTYDTAAPTVTLTAPANNTFTTSTTPTLSGAAGNLTGDSTTVTVKIYNGTGTGGTVNQTLTPTRTGATWTTTASTLMEGTYTAQSTQTDTAGNTGTSSANTFTVDTTAPTATNVLLTNGGTLGRATADDTVVVTYSEAMDPSAFCSTWANDGTNQSLSGNGQVVVTIADNASNDTLTVTASGCTFTLGSIALNANYVTSNVSFSGNGSNASELQWNFAARTLTIVFGNGTGQSTGVAASTPTYTASTALRDRAGNAIGAGPYTGTNSRF